MSELSTTDIPGWVHTSLQGEEIFDASIPAELQLPEDSTPVVLNNEVAHLFESSERDLYHVSKNHGRSYEMGPNASRNRLARIAIWHDEVDNPYTSFSLKGNNFSRGTVMESSTAPSGYIPMGLLESDALLRVIRSSRMLRQAGISTEWISRVFEPQSLIYKGELVSQEEYKRRLLVDTANEKGIEEMVKISSALEPMTFFITGRSMEINDRLADFNLDTPKTASDRMKHIFRVYNATHSNDEDFRPLYYSREADRTRFFRHIFPSLLGENLAKLHNIGLVHTFPTLSNVTILGGIIDLDSVRGLPLEMDDKPVGRTDMHKDLAMITDYDHDPLAIKELYTQLYRLGLTKQPGDFIWAQAELVDAYRHVRDQAPLKRDRIIDELYLSGVNHNFDGPLTWEAYKALYKGEAHKMSKMIWTLSGKRAEGIWEIDHLKTVAGQEIDAELHSISLDLENPNDTVNLTLEHFKTLEKEVRRSADIEAYSPTDIVKDIEAHIDQFPRLRALIPDEQTRARVITSMTTTLAIKASEVIAKNFEPEIKQLISEAVDTVTREFLDNLSEDSWRTYVIKLDSFKDLGERPADGFRVMNQKSVFGYGDMDFEEFVQRIQQEDLRIILSSQKIESEDHYYFTAKGFTQRLMISDAIKPRLHGLYVSDEGYNVVGATIENSIEDTTYIAWICEPQTEGEKPVVVIRHRNVADAEARLDTKAQ